MNGAKKKNGVGVFKFNLRSSSHQWSHTIYPVVCAMARYEASALEGATVSCFFLFQDSGESPPKMEKPVVEHLSEGSPAQSASVVARNSKEDDDGKNDGSRKGTSNISKNPMNCCKVN